jgi:hypothetical protein
MAPIAVSFNAFLTID